MKLDNNNIRMCVTILLNEVEGNNTSTDTIDKIMSIIENDINVYEIEVIEVFLEEKLLTVDSSLKLKAEQVLDFNINDNMEDVVDKIIALIGYSYYSKQLALEFLNANKVELNIGDNTSKSDVNTLYTESYSGAIDILIDEYQIDKSQIFEINNLSQYIHQLDTFRGMYVSRGHSNVKYHFLPTAHRNNDGYFLSNIDVRNLQSEFKRKVVHYHPEFKNKTSWELTAFAQHYGIPTYMLDFTESHLVSLLFSLENLDFTNDGVVMFIDYQKYNEDYHDLNYVVDCSDSKMLHGKMRLATDDFLQNIREPIFIKSDSLNDRIHFQKGVFLLFPSQVDLTTNENYAKIKDVSNYMKLIIIPKDVKKDLIRELFNIGMTFESIYPDLDNAVRSIKFKSQLEGR